MIRKVKTPLVDSLDLFIESSHEITDYKLYYDFIVKSFYVNRQERFSLSDLHRYLSEKNVKDKKELLLIYMHSLYVLAINEDLSIYGNGFNV